MRCMISVSYTHLDVYKRQAFIHAVYHLDRIPAQLDTEDLDPEKRLYRQLESTILDLSLIHI